MAFQLKLQTKHIIIPYIIGLGWFLCHPIFSIITGESKCRGIYTDEHQLDIRAYKTDTYPSKQITSRRNIKDVTIVNGVPVAMDHSNVCNALDTMKDEYDTLQNYDDNDNDDQNAFNPYLSPYITCYNQAHTKNDFSIVKIKPSLAPTSSVEALVLVIPYAYDWFKSDLHSAMLTFMERMAKSPWLAKDILILSPNSNSTTVGDVVENFMEDLPSLPMTLTQYLIRQLVVLEMQVSTDYMQDEFVVLTQGNFGTVPNMDLISGLTTSVREVFGRKSVMTMHPFDLSWWIVLVRKHLPQGSGWQEWGNDLGNMIAFMATFWRPAPHAAALAQGIDSVTIQAQLQLNEDDRYVQESAVLTVTLVEHFFRGLNSLSERFHHNANQYLLPSSTKFVSHDEYIIPAILIMLPLLLRALKLILQDMEQFQIERGATTSAGAISIAGVLFYCQHLTNYEGNMKFMTIITIYIFALILAFSPMLAKRTRPHDERFGQQSIQFIACMVTLCIHAPLALSHYSLFMVSALVWVPLVAFVDYGAKVQKVPGIVLLGLAVAAYQDIVPILPLTIYSSVVVVPLHFFVVVLSLG